MSRPLFIVLALGLIALVFWRVRPKTNYEYAFQNRATVQPTLFRRIWHKTLPPEVVRRHAAVSENVLIVRDIRVVNHPYFRSPSNGDWSFAGVIRRAFQVGQVPTGTAQTGLVMGMQSALRHDFSTAGDDFIAAWNSTDLTQAPVHLLAIVNRLDKAIVDLNGCPGYPTEAGLDGAEVRFVYEALPYQGKDYLNLIVEFVLPCVTPDVFQRWTKCWVHLQNLSMDPDGNGKYVYQEALEKVVDQLTSWPNAKARLRAIGADSSHTWEPREFLFQPSGLVLNRLERQPNIKLPQCQNSNSDLGKFAAAHTQRILESDYQYDGVPSLVCSPSCDRCVAVINNQNKRVLVLGKGVLPDDVRDNVRFALSVNSCTACHGPETGVDISQIGHRPTDDSAPSPLSGFLTGYCPPAGARNPKAGSDDGIPYCTVQVSSTPSPLGTCAGVTEQPRSFNDLLRRDLFLYVVQQLDPHAPAQTWKDKLAPFTAYEVD